MGNGRLNVFICLLIFTLFIQLTVASAKEEIILLITIGAAPKQLQRFLIKQFIPSNIISIIIALIIVAVLQFILQKVLASQNIFISQYISYYTIIAGLQCYLFCFFL